MLISIIFGVFLFNFIFQIKYLNTNLLVEIMLENQLLFIENQKLVVKKLKTLQPLEQYDDQYESLYIDPITQEQWEKYKFDNEEERYTLIGLRKLPYPKINNLIHLIINSPHEDEVEGGSALLYDFIQEGKKVNHLILDSIAKNKHNISLNRYTSIYYRAELYSNRNCQPILGKSIDQIEEEAKYYAQNAIRAKALYKEFKQNNSLISNSIHKIKSLLNPK